MSKKIVFLFLIFAEFIGCKLKSSQDIGKQNESSAPEGVKPPTTNSNKESTEKERLDKIGDGIKNLKNYSGHDLPSLFNNLRNKNSKLAEELLSGENDEGRVKDILVNLEVVQDNQVDIGWWKKESYKAFCSIYTPMKTDRNSLLNHPPLNKNDVYKQKDFKTLAFKFFNILGTDKKLDEKIKEYAEFVNENYISNFFAKFGNENFSPDQLIENLKSLFDLLDQCKKEGVNYKSFFYEYLTIEILKNKNMLVFFNENFNVFKVLSEEKRFRYDVKELLLENFNYMNVFFENKDNLQNPEAIKKTLDKLFLLHSYDIKQNILNFLAECHHEKFLKVIACQDVETGMFNFIKIKHDNKNLLEKLSEEHLVLLIKNDYMLPQRETTLYQILAGEYGGLTERGLSNYFSIYKNDKFFRSGIKENLCYGNTNELSDQGKQELKFVIKLLNLDDTSIVSNFYSGFGYEKMIKNILKYEQNISSEKMEEYIEELKILFGKYSKDEIKNFCHFDEGNDLQLILEKDSKCQIFFKDLENEKYTIDDITKIFRSVHRYDYNLKRRQFSSENIDFIKELGDKDKKTMLSILKEGYSCYPPGVFTKEGMEKLFNIYDQYKNQDRTILEVIISNFIGEKHEKNFEELKKWVEKNKNLLGSKGQFEKDFKIFLGLNN